MSPEQYVELLKLQPHPEGGWYRETFRSNEIHAGDTVFPAGRNYATAIYFLITAGNFSAFHRIKSDETWHFYSGDALEVIQIDAAGNFKKILLGNDLNSGAIFQYTVPAGVWFASRVSGKGKFALTGCTVAPGFDFRDFEIAEREKMIKQFPEHRNIITSLTRI